MPAVSTRPLVDVLSAWHEFYSMTGESSATLIGLMFVAASVSSGIFSLDRRAALRVFLSATLVNFSSILATSMVVLSPIGSWALCGALIVACGLLGLAHTGLACRDAVRDNLLSKVDLEDRTWYLLFPIVGYLGEGAAGVALLMRLDRACTALGLSTAMLLLVGVHNAWDITVWTISRRRQD